MLLTHAPRSRRLAPAARALAVAAVLPALALPVAAPTVLAPPVAAAAEDDPTCESPQADGPRTVQGPNLASEALDVPRATALAAKEGVREAGDGVTVVVVDAPFGGLDPATFEGLDTGHGVTVAGIIRGRDQQSPPVPVGIAPGARLEERPFYVATSGSGDDGKPEPTSAALGRVLSGLAGDVRSGRLGERTVVVVPTEVQATPALRAAVGRLHAAGALVVAAAGDRGAAEFLDDYDDGGPAAGEDAAADVGPAASDDVLTVGVSSPGATNVLRNSQTDVAAPGLGSVSISVEGGGSCLVTSVSSHWAAAQVAGVAALVWSVHRGDTADELRARLEGTATGNGSQASPLTGFGMVQPVEAIQRPVEGMDGTGAGGEVVPRGEVPEERADLLATTRRDAVWWGLAGGGALVVLLVLRPVLARRR